MSSNKHNRNVPYHDLLIALRRAAIIILDALEEALEYEQRNRDLRE